MKKLKKHIFYILFSLLIACGLLCSCHDDTSEQFEDNGENLNISLTLLTGLNATRADSFGHAEVGSEYRDFEEGIDLKDVAIFVFAGLEGEESDERLLLKTINIGMSNDPDMSITGNTGLYNITMKFPKKDLQDAIGKELKRDDVDNIKFRILLLANCSSPGTNGMAKWSQITGATFPEVIDQLNAWNFAISYLYDHNGNDEITSIYPVVTKKRIPMFGTREFILTQRMLIDSRPEEKLFLGSIDMLRALAKVRVIDNIEGKDTDNYPRIIRVEFHGSQDSAKQLPDDARNYRNGSQVHTPHIAAPDNELSLENAVVYRMGKMPDEWNMTPASERKGSTFVSYVPEQKIGLRQSGIAGGMPVIRITVAKGKDDDGSEVVETYDVAMTSYGSAIFGYGDAILRNHIYNLTVKGISDEGPAIYARIVPWVYDRQHIELTE